MSKQSRLPNVELLRIVSMLLIITGHLLGENGADLLGKTDQFSTQWYILWAIEAFCVAGTNCFVIISGYFMIDSTFSWKKVLKLCFQVWFYSYTLYAINLIVNPATFSIRNLFKVATPILGRSWWFISTYLGLYILSPFINMLLKSISK